MEVDTYLDENSLDITLESQNGNPSKCTNNIIIAATAHLYVTETNWKNYHREIGQFFSFSPFFPLVP